MPGVVGPRAASSVVVSLGVVMLCLATFVVADMVGTGAAGVLWFVGLLLLFVGLDGMLS